MKSKLLRALIIIFIFLKIITLCVFIYRYKSSSVFTYSEQELENIKNKVKTSEVIAKTNKDTKIYKDVNLKNFISTIPNGEEVEILQDKSTKVYLVKSSNFKLKGWVSFEDLEIPKDPETNTQKLQKSELEVYINSLDLNSVTGSLVWVDIDRQLVYIFKGKFKNWKLEKTLVCATGLNKSPTTRGVFKISDKGEWFYSDRLGSGAKYWLRFNGSYLFHSVAMDKNQNVIDKTLGQRCSSGCVRLSLKDIEWFYSNIERDTTVFVN